MKNKGSNEWKGYLNYSLTSADKKAIVDGRPSDTDLLSWLGEILEFGCSVSMAYQEKDGSLRLTVTGRSTNTHLDGYSVSAWGGEPTQCLAVIHYVWCSGRYGENLEGLIPLESEDWWPG
jgi:hypothetical protein